MSAVPTAQKQTEEVAQARALGVCEEQIEQLKARGFFGNGKFLTLVQGLIEFLLKSGLLDNLGGAQPPVTPPSA